MTVYVVLLSEESAEGGTCEGVFSTREKAEEYIRVCHDEYFEEWGDPYVHGGIGNILDAYEIVEMDLDDEQFTYNGRSAPRVQYADETK